MPLSLRYEDRIRRNCPLVNAPVDPRGIRIASVWGDVGT